MVEIRKCDVNDASVKLFDDLIKIFGLVVKPEIIYELYVDGRKGYLLNQGNNFYIVDLKNGLDHFSVVDGQVVYYHCEVSGLALKSGNIYKFDEFNRIQDFVFLLPYVGTPVKYQSVNASLNHIHFDYDLKKKYILSYYYFANFDNKDKISQAFFSEPYFIEFGEIDNPNDTKSYYLTHWYAEEKYYNIALMKTVGLVDYFLKDYAGDIDVYYDRLVRKQNLVSFKDLLLSEQIHPEDIDNILLESGYDGYVSDDIIDAFNKEDKKYLLYKEIYDKWLSISKSERLVHKLAM